MNKQTPGPLHVEDENGINDSEGFRVALALGGFPYEANAALFASAYSTFDRAGRELGIDAAELARTIDLTAILRFIWTIKDAEPSGPLTECDGKTNTGALLASCDAHAIANIARRARELCVLDKKMS